jgi:hypothetical protein
VVRSNTAYRRPDWKKPDGRGTVKLGERQRVVLRRCRQTIRDVLAYVGFDDRDIARIVFRNEFTAFMNGHLSLEHSRVLSVSSFGFFGSLGFKHFRRVEFPDFDICADKLDEKFDLIVAEQVFEHLKYPYTAAKNVYEMLEDGGWFCIATPLLFCIHNHPIDCTRWTPTGLKYFLESVGFKEDRITVGAWGNRSYIVKHLFRLGLTRSPRKGFFGSLRNEDRFPVTVWAFAQK